MGPADEFLMQYETCYAYNESFGFYYKVPMIRHDCEKFVADRNQCKGGHWEVRRFIDYKSHFEALKDCICAGDGSELLQT